MTTWAIFDICVCCSISGAFFTLIDHQWWRLALLVPSAGIYCFTVWHEQRTHHSSRRRARWRLAVEAVVRATLRMLDWLAEEER